jgi:hypothetical protein
MTRRAKKPHRPGKSRALAILISHDDDAILTFAEWCSLNRISQRQGRRILKAPGGPVITQLSAHRIGISRTISTSAPLRRRGLRPLEMQFRQIALDPA